MYIVKNNIVVHNLNYKQKDLSESNKMISVQEKVLCGNAHVLHIAALNM